MNSTDIFTAITLLSLLGVVPASTIRVVDRRVLLWLPESRQR